MGRAARARTGEEAQCTLGLPFSPKPTLSLPTPHPQSEEQCGGERPWVKRHPSFCCWKPPLLAALGRAAQSSAGFDYSHELQSVLWWRPPPQICLSLQTSPPSHYLPGRRLLRGVGHTRRDESPPARLQACHHLSSNARLALGSPRPWPCSLALSQKLPTPQNHPGGTLPIPFNVELRVSWFLCMQSVW